LHTLAATWAPIYLTYRSLSAIRRTTALEGSWTFCSLSSWSRTSWCTPRCLIFVVNDLVSQRFMWAAEYHPTWVATIGKPMPAFHRWPCMERIRKRVFIFSHDTGRSHDQLL
jgi:hypothetical protein